MISRTTYRRSGLAEVAQLNKDRLYRALDHLLPHKAALEAHLKSRIGTLFDEPFDILLYDLTSTYFEGLAEGNPQARRGYSRDHRPDCVQVVIGLVVTKSGLPLGYEVFAGNQAEPPTLEDMMAKMETLYGKPLGSGSSTGVWRARGTSKLCAKREGSSSSAPRARYCARWRRELDESARGHRGQAGGFS